MPVHSCLTDMKYHVLTNAFFKKAPHTFCQYFQCMEDSHKVQLISEALGNSTRIETSLLNFQMAAKSCFLWKKNYNSVVLRKTITFHFGSQTD